MTSRLNSDLLNDTLNVVQLARQAAMARGSQDRAGKLSSVASELHKVVSEAGQSKGDVSVEKATFDSLLSSIQGGQNQAETGPKTPVTQTAGTPPTSIQERNLLVSAMASGTMSEVEIARQLGITRDEVRAILSLNKAKPPQEYSPNGGEL